VKEFPKFSVAKALVNHPDRVKIVAEMPDITEREARAKAKEFKKAQAIWFPLKTVLILNSYR
jgi:hypothetical protein